MIAGEASIALQRKTRCFTYTESLVPVCLNCLQKQREALSFIKGLRKVQLEDLKTISGVEQNSLENSPLGEMAPLSADQGEL